MYYSEPVYALLDFHVCYIISYMHVSTAIS